LGDWGVPVSERTAPLDPQQAVTLETLALQAYEAGRPSEAEACRVGDARFLVTVPDEAGADQRSVMPCVGQGEGA